MESQISRVIRIWHLMQKMFGILYVPYCPLKVGQGPRIYFLAQEISCIQDTVHVYADGDNGKGSY